MKRLAVLSLTLLALFLLIGCGPAAKDYKYHSGKGQIDGTVSEGSSIMFFPVGDSNFVGTGTIQKDGSFTLVTNLARPEKKVPGIPEGDYKVRINVANSMKEIGEPELPSKVTVKLDDPMIRIKMADSP